MIVSVTPRLAASQTTLMPRKGRHFVGVGATVNGGMVVSDNRSSFDAPTAGGYPHLDLFQQLSRSGFARLSVGAGFQWLDRHEASPDGNGKRQTALSWSIDVGGYWLPAGARDSWALGGAFKWTQIRADRANIHSYGLEPRLGYFFWPSTESFVSTGIGYTIPVVQGLSGGSLSNSREGRPLPDWALHQFTLDVTYAF